MLKSFKEIIENAKKGTRKTISVAVAQDSEVLKAVRMAKDHGISDAILVGDKEEINRIAKENGILVEDFKIIDIIDKVESCKKAVQLVSSGDAQIIMKGIIDSSIVLKAVLDKDNNLRGHGIISHVSVLEISNLNKMIMLTDAAMNILPNLETKKLIIKNSIKVANVLGYNNPKIACLCAVEKLSTKMQATMDAAELVRLNEIGEIKGCVVGGPFALDNAISEEAARHKGIDHPVAGNADILLVPNIEAGNVLHKSIVFIAKEESAGIIVGAKIPIIMTSRSESNSSKLNSIALGVLLSNKEFKDNGL